MKLKLCIGVVLFAVATAWAQTNNLTTLLQQGLFEEQANRNLDAAIENYAVLARQFDKDRQLAATAVFRLGECYRAQGKTNEAAVQYQRILRDFADQQTLATLSRQNLTGMSVAQGQTPSAAPTKNPDAVLLKKLEGMQRDDLEKVLPTVMPDPALSDLLQKRDAALAERNQLLVSWGTNSLQVTRSDALLAELNRQIGGKISGMLQGLKLRSQLSDTSVGDARQQQQKELLAKQITLAEQDLADAKKMVQVGKATQVELRAAEREVLRLRQQLTALDANQLIRVDLPDLSVPATSEEDQEIARIKQMIQNSPDLINAPMSGANQRTPLVNAAQKGWVQAVKYLLDNGAQMDNSALFVATSAGHKAMVELLLERGADVNARDDENATPLHRAAQNGFLSVAEVLIQHKADLEARTKIFNSMGLGRREPSWNSGETPLQRALNARRPAMVELLLAKGADVNTTNDWGKTPLACAAQNNNLPAVNQLIKAGAKLDVTDKDKTTALEFAVQRGNLECAKALLAAKANPNAGNDSAILLAAIQYPEILKTLLAAGAKPGTNEALIFTALPRPESLKLLLDAGVSPKIKGALVMAIYQGQEQSAALLAQAGADVNAPGMNDMTPLMMAVWKQNLPILSMLLTNKVDINARHPSRRTALDMSKEAERSFRPSTPGDYGGSINSPDKELARKISEMLRKHGALDKLPEWDRIAVTRPSWSYSEEMAWRGTNDWNHFTLLELLYTSKWRKDQLKFPDLANVVIVRPASNGTEFRRMTVNLLNATNGLDCSRDVLLEFGDTVEIPEREHSLAEKEVYLTSEQDWAILNHFRSQKNEAKLIVGGGAAVTLTLQPFFSVIGDVLSRAPALNALTSNSDLSQVKVTRKNPKAKKPESWVLDCRNLNDQSRPNFWLRDGDVIEVPEKP